MRFPRLRLPRPSLSLEWLGGWNGRLILLYIGYTAVLFVAFLLLTFPHELLIRRLLGTVNRGSVAVDFNTARFAWFKGFEVSGVRVAPADDGRTPYVECSRLWVWPALGALVRGRPYDLMMRADLYGGSADGEVRIVDGSLTGTLQWQGADLGRYRTLTSLLDEGQLVGRLGGQLTFETRPGKPESNQVTGEVLLDGAALTAAKVGGFGVPDIRFRQTKVKFAVRGDRLEVQDFNAAGDVNVQASGQIILRDPLPESVLNLRATIEQSLATPDAIKTLVALIPRGPGAKADAPVIITGTLGRPRVR